MMEKSDSGCIEYSVEDREMILLANLKEILEGRLLNVGVVDGWSNRFPEELEYTARDRNAPTAIVCPDRMDPI
jgi:hypothetical protein